MRWEGKTVDSEGPELVTGEISAVSPFLGNSVGHFLLQPLPTATSTPPTRVILSLAPITTLSPVPVGLETKEGRRHNFRPVLGKGVKKGLVEERKEVEAFEMKAGPSSSEINVGEAQLV